MAGVKLINSESFAEIRTGNGAYVDKTGFLEEFLTDPDDATRPACPAAVSLFTRPRRFGKTTFLSMLAEFFACRENEDATARKRRRALFRGLKVAANKKLCARWMHQHPVIFLTLKGIGKPDYGRSLAMLRDRISVFCSRHTYLLTSPNVPPREKRLLPLLLKATADEDTLALALDVLVTAMSCHFQKPAIVLIDEYDSPLEQAYEFGYANEMRAFMGAFFSHALKTHGESLQFAILAGCLRLAREHLESCFHNPQCYGVADARFADVCGFTQAEVDQLLAHAGFLHKREALRAWYDGYRFGNTQAIYCPWSILNALSDMQKDPAASPKAHWRLSSQNALIRTFLAEKMPEIGADMATLLAGSCLVQQISEAPAYESQDLSPDNIWSLFAATGYLTKAPEEKEAQCQPNPGSGGMALVLPNKESRQLFVEEMSHWFTAVVSPNRHNALQAAFWQADAAQLVQVLDKIRKDLPEHKSSTHDLAHRENDDAALRANFSLGLLAGSFLSACPKTLASLEAGRGRLVLQVLDETRADGSRAALVALARTADESANLSALAQDGLDRIRKMQEMQDKARLLTDPAITTVLHWSIAFCTKDCQARAIVVQQPA